MKKHAEFQSRTQMAILHVALSFKLLVK